jgi:DNA ligase-1
VEAVLTPIFESHPDIILDGELYNHDLKFESIQSIVSRDNFTEAQIENATEQIQYHIYDVILPGSPPYEVRNPIYTELVNSLSDPTQIIRLVNTHVVNSVEELEALAVEYRDNGYEGVMFRVPTSKYHHGRTKNLLKYKVFKDEEFVIEDVCEGKGNKSGMAGNMILRLPDGRTFSSNIQGDRAYMKFLLENRTDYIGKTATCKFQDYTEKGVPRFPYVIKVARETYE